MTQCPCHRWWTPRLLTSPIGTCGHTLKKGLSFLSADGTLPQRPTVGLGNFKNGISQARTTSGYGAVIMIQPNAKELFQAGVHVGHQVKRWNPRSKPYVYANRYGISIINLEKTVTQLAKACQAVENLVSSGGRIWFVGTKPQAQEIIREAARNAGMPFCSQRWLGGTLTNFRTVNRSLQKFKRLLKMEEKGEIDQMPNKEASALRREMARMQKNFEGLLEISELPDALFVVDVCHEAIAVREARRLNILTIGLVDSNANPGEVDICIPGNDDSSRSIRIIVDTVAGAVRVGLESRELRALSRASHGQAETQALISPEVNLSETAEVLVEMAEEDGIEE
ncbi:MAG: 30S ribosomal protein S2 [Puniceicoccales bacterium]|nr:30S ribosomal protein S2 [Puniceicoccales bacterium]